MLSKIGENRTLEHDQQRNKRDRLYAFKKRNTGTAEIIQLTFLQTVELVDYQQNIDVRKKVECSKYQQ